MNKITTVQCVICNTTFQPRRNKRDGVQKCCSNTCRGTLKSRTKVLHPKTCLACGKDFNSRSRGKTGLLKYCSMECASIGYKRNAAGPALYEKRLMDSRKINLETGCWEWVGLLSTSGYGKLKASGITTSPHRLAAHLYLGMPLNSTAFVCHTCDNRACFNPAHLYLGDAKTNAGDRQDRHRGADFRGHRHGMAKLTEEQAKEVIEFLKTGRLHADIAAMYGVSRVAITCISTRKTWKHLPRTS